MEKVRVNFDIDKSIHTRAKALALKKETTIKALYTQWINEGLERETSQTTLYDEKEWNKDNNVELKKNSK